MSKHIAIALVLAACSAQHETKPVVKKSPATQADLAREIDDAEHRGTQATIKQHWQGLALHWTVTRQRLLCLSADACHIAPFAIERPAKHGWLPALAFAPGEFQKVVSGCGAAEQCTLELDFRLDQLNVSAEAPTSMKFSDVRVVSAHAA
jgi:hypothetical protein